MATHSSEVLRTRSNQAVVNARVHAFEELCAHKSHQRYNAHLRQLTPYFTQPAEHTLLHVLKLVQSLCEALTIDDAYLANVFIVL